jgi:hypothetical protein
MYQDYLFNSIAVEAARYFSSKRKRVDNNPEEFKKFEDPDIYKLKLVDPELKIKKEVNQIKLHLRRKKAKRNSKRTTF